MINLVKTKVLNNLGESKAGTNSIDQCLTLKTKEGVIDLVYYRTKTDCLWADDILLNNEVYFDIDYSNREGYFYVSKNPPFIKNSNGELIQLDDDYIFKNILNWFWNQKSIKPYFLHCTNDIISMRYNHLQLCLQLDLDKYNYSNIVKKAIIDFNNLNIVYFIRIFRDYFMNKDYNVKLELFNDENNYVLIDIFGCDETENSIKSQSIKPTETPSTISKNLISISETNNPYLIGFGRNTKEYRDFVKDVKERDNYTCQVCGLHKPKRIDVHHINSYQDYPMLRTDIKNGVSLCQWCHGRYHSIYGIKHSNENDFKEYTRRFGVINL